MTRMTRAKVLVFRVVFFYFFWQLNKSVATKENMTVGNFPRPLLVNI